MSDAQLAYLAGFFDGEGCIHLSDRKRHNQSPYLSVVLSNTCLELMTEIHVRYGGSLGDQTNASRTFVCHQLCLRSQGAARFLQELMPYLRLKQPEAELALEFQAHLSSKPRITSEVAKYRESMIARMKALKAGKRVRI